MEAPTFDKFLTLILIICFLSRAFESLIKLHVNMIGTLEHKKTNRTVQLPTMTVCLLNEKRDSSNSTIELATLNTSVLSLTFKNT